MSLKKFNYYDGIVPYGLFVLFFIVLLFLGINYGSDNTEKEYITKQIPCKKVFLKGYYLDENFSIGQKGIDDKTNGIYDYLDEVLYVNLKELDSNTWQVYDGGRGFVNIKAYEGTRKDCL